MQPPQVSQFPCPGVHASSVLIHYEHGKQEYLHLREVEAFGRNDTNMLLHAVAEASSTYRSPRSGNLSPGFCVDGNKESPLYCHTNKDVDAFFKFYFPTNQTCVTSVE